jgi:nitrous oxide reductase accessory protein NosL
MRDRLAAGALVLLVATLAGCAPQGPPAIRIGMTCAACGMTVEDLRFACTRRDPATRGTGWRVYDSIECLAREWQPGLALRDVHAADYDQKHLHRADSLWVVKGSFPSPMGGGLAAFLDRDAARVVAGETHGEVMPFDSLLSRAGGDRR